MSTAAAKQSEELKQHAKDQEWWWVAEKSRSKRLDYLRKAVWKKGAIGGAYNPGIKIDIERPLLFTEAWKENDRDPQMLRKAKALANVLENKTIFITDHAQLVGYAGGLPNSLQWCVEGASMVNEEVYNEAGVIPEPQEESLKTIAELTDYWGGKTSIDRLGRVLDPEDLVKFMSGVIGWGTPTSAYGYAGKDYEYILTGKRGFEDIINEIDGHMDAAEKKTSGNPGPDLLPLYDKMLNWEAMQIILEACIKHSERYARLARIIAENFESDPKRKEELLRISETCEQVPAKTPRNLQESFQLGHFIQIFTRHEAFEGAMPCRPDYYHGPYYDKDVNIDKRLTKEEALDLV
ncbi:MAG: formate acetyltransferase, partial [Desulfobacteraceae bacterium]